MPRQFQKCYKSVRVGIGGQGVEPPVREHLRLAPGKGGIKVRLGQPNLVFYYYCAISQNLSIVK